MDGRPINMEASGEIKERYMLVEYSGEGRDGSVDKNCPWKYDSENLAVSNLVYTHIHSRFKRLTACGRVKREKESIIIIKFIYSGTTHYVSNNRKNLHYVSI
jgi:hypothetical protein